MTWFSYMYSIQLDITKGHSLHTELVAYNVYYCTMPQTLVFKLLTYVLYHSKCSEANNCPTTPHFIFLYTYTTYMYIRVSGYVYLYACIQVDTGACLKASVLYGSCL